MAWYISIQHKGIGSSYFLYTAHIAQNCGFNTESRHSVRWPTHADSCKGEKSGRGRLKAELEDNHRLYPEPPILEADIKEPKHQVLLL